MSLFADNISLWYNQFSFLKNITLHIKDGEWVSFYGPSGSGKTTLLKTLWWLMNPLDGKLCIHNKDITSYNNYELRLLRQKTFWYIFTEGFFIDAMTVEENIRLRGHFTKELFPKERFEELVLFLDIGHILHVPVQELSTGQRERVSLVCGILHSPKYIIIDEPGSSLDEVMKQKVLLVLKKEQDNWNTILCASHDTSIIQYSTSIYTIHDATIHLQSSQK